MTLTIDEIRGEAEKMAGDELWLDPSAWHKFSFAAEAKLLARGPQPCSRCNGGGIEPTCSPTGEPSDD